MKLALDRAEADQYATRSTLTVDGKSSGFVLEPAGANSVTGRHRIPAGTYAIELKPIGTSHFDKDASAIMAKAGGQHLGMLRLVDVPGRSEILIHWGNFWQDSEGCLLVGLGTMEQHGAHAVTISREAYAQLYPKVAQAALNLDASIIIAEGK